MSFWRVISEAQSLRTEFLRTTMVHRCTHTVEVRTEGLGHPPNRILQSSCARLLFSEPWSLERFQVYSVVWSRRGYLISLQSARS
jgi:hypothetical protein